MAKKPNAFLRALSCELVDHEEVEESRVAEEPRTTGTGETQVGTVVGRKAESGSLSFFQGKKFNRVKSDDREMSLLDTRSNQNNAGNLDGEIPSAGQGRSEMQSQAISVSGGWRANSSSKRAQPLLQLPASADECKYLSYITVDASMIDDEIENRNRLSLNRSRSSGSRQKRRDPGLYHCTTEVFDDAEVIEIHSADRCTIEITPQSLPADIMDLMRAGSHIALTEGSHFELTWQAKALRETGFRLRGDGNLSCAFAARLRGCKGPKASDPLAYFAKTALRELTLGQKATVHSYGQDETGLVVVDITLLPNKSTTVSENLIRRGIVRHDTVHDFSGSDLSRVESTAAEAGIGIWSKRPAGN